MLKCWPEQLKQLLQVTGRSQLLPTEHQHCWDNRLNQHMPVANITINMTKKSNINVMESE